MMVRINKARLLLGLILLFASPAGASEQSLECQLSAVGIMVSKDTLAAIQELESTASSSGTKWGFLSQDARNHALSKLEEIASVPRGQTPATETTEILNRDLRRLLDLYKITGDELSRDVFRLINVALHTHIEIEIRYGSHKSLRWLIEHIRANTTLARIKYDPVGFLNSVPHQAFEEIFQYLASTRSSKLEPLVLQEMAQKLTETAIHFDLAPDLYRLGTLTIRSHEMTVKEKNELIPLPVMPIQVHGSYLESFEGIEADLREWKKLLEAYRRVAPEFLDDASGVKRYTPVQAAYQRALNKETDSRRRVVLTWTYKSLMFELNDDIARGVEGAIRRLQRLGDHAAEEERFTAAFMDSLPKNYFAKDELESWELFRERDVLVRELGAERSRERDEETVRP